MQQLTPKVVAILVKYMRDPAASVAGSTKLGALDIDLLDLPMIFLDIEDAFDVRVGSDDEIDGSTTIRALVARITSRLRSERLQPRRKTTVPPSTGNWMSTGGERRR